MNKPLQCFMKAKQNSVSCLDDIVKESINDKMSIGKVSSRIEGRKTQPFWLNNMVTNRGGSEGGKRGFLRPGG